MTTVSDCDSRCLCARSSRVKCSAAICGAVRGTGSSIDSIVDCASRSPAIRLEIERLGFGLFASSTAPPKDERAPCLPGFGDEDARFMLVELDARRKESGRGAATGDDAGCEVRREASGVLRAGVAGAEDIGLLVLDVCLDLLEMSLRSSFIRRLEGDCDEPMSCAIGGSMATRRLEQMCGNIGACDRFGTCTVCTPQC